MFAATLYGLTEFTQGFEALNHRPCEWNEIHQGAFMYFSTSA
jgi:hypothetical protein